MRGRTRAAGWAAVVTLLISCTACTGGSDDGDASPGPDERGPARTLRVLASSELSDMKPVLDAAREATGITVSPTYVGTLDGAELVSSGKADGKYDAVWLSSNDYLRLDPSVVPRISSETPVMTSPVALGVKAETVSRLGWNPSTVTWSQVHRAVADGKLTYGMTDPERSNSGFAALVSVTSGLSGAQAALTEGQIREATPRLREFFAGQELTSGSSGWLASAYERRGTVDAMVNYESVLLSLNRDEGGDAGSRLTVIRPKDGVVTADYPFTLLTSADEGAREAGRELTEYLRGPEAQQAITTRTLRRPVVTSVKPAPGIGREGRRELPFPGSRSVADGLLDAYENELRRPSRTVYVLDTSGSMDGDRLARLKSALGELTGDFREREEVTLMPFGSAVKQIRTRTIDPGDPSAAVAALDADIAALSAQGDTAIYSSLKEAYGVIGAPRNSGPSFTSIVLMTDGENTAGDAASGFDSFYRALPAGQRRTPVFPILFGDSDRRELTDIATLTGGRLFDANKGSLDGAFEEIRGYQ
ncbi:extracellular solute-binding protein [Streptomyces sp. NPDC058653]|uniref:substrate-binding and vWA domain-containing protein n=1 Tax=Streptomyces sp. NPDC058653 TaxID=3346576 RepID=UPI003648528F